MKNHAPIYTKNQSDFNKRLQVLRNHLPCLHQQRTDLQEAQIRKLQEKVEALKAEIGGHEARIVQQKQEIDAIYAELDKTLWLQGLGDADSGSDSDDSFTFTDTMCGRHFSLGFRVGLQRIIQEFTISGDRISPLVHRVLALMTNLTLEEI